MKKVSLHGQLTFDKMKGSFDRLSMTNRWVQMGDSLPWTEYEKVYNKRLMNGTVGASNRPGRMVIAALIINTSSVFPMRRQYSPSRKIPTCSTCAA